MKIKYFVVADRDCPGWETEDYEEAVQELKRLQNAGNSKAIILRDCGNYRDCDLPEFSVCKHCNARIHKVLNLWHDGPGVFPQYCRTTAENEGSQLHEPSSSHF